MTKRFKLYDEETLDTHIEDNEDCYGDGTPKSYWFGENEDFCNLFYKLNELSDKNEQLKQRINSRLHFYRELYGSTNDNVVKRVIEDLEDILK